MDITFQTTPLLPTVWTLPPITAHAIDPNSNKSEQDIRTGDSQATSHEALEPRRIFYHMIMGESNEVTYF